MAPRFSTTVHLLQRGLPLVEGATSVKWQVAGNFPGGSLSAPYAQPRLACGPATLASAWTRLRQHSLTIVEWLRDPLLNGCDELCHNIENHLKKSTR